MRTIVHVSDLHFGRADPRLREELLAMLRELEPSLVVVSGDLTQRARRRQFEQARAFLDRIAAPTLVVPGNHDVPLYDVARRFLAPLGRYKRYITRDLAPFYTDDEIAVLGVNTARSNVWKGGRLSLFQIEGIRARLCAEPDTKFKILVVHHPFIPPPDRPREDMVDRGAQALLVAEECGAQLVLAGHLHLGYTGDVRTHHPSIARQILVAQAGTAISTRRRSGEPNSFNVVVVDGQRLSLRWLVWDGSAFTQGGASEYLCSEQGWAPAPSPA